MLRVRAITGLLAAALGLAALFGAPPWGFALIAALVFPVLGGREAARLAGYAQPASQWLNSALLLGACALLWPLVLVDWPLLVLVPAVWLWLGPFLWLRFFEFAATPGPATRLLKVAAGWVIIVPAWFSVVWLQQLSPWLVFLLVISIAVADIGAYFTGRAIGGPKLAVRISPGKTWAGVGGALVLAPAATAITVALLPVPWFSPWSAALLAALLTPVSIAGDLFVSLLKRHIGMKDSGRLLPGHGGILDRFDSLSAALPFFALAVWLLRHFSP